MNPYEQHAVDTITGEIRDLQAQQAGAPTDPTIAPLITDLQNVIVIIKSRAAQPRS